MWKEEVFVIELTDGKYLIEPMDTGYLMKFKVSTDKQYLSTLYVDDYGDWQTEPYNNLISQDLLVDVAKAIESYYA